MKNRGRQSIAKVKIYLKSIPDMDTTIIVPQSVRVLVKLGDKRKRRKVEELVGMLKDYKDTFTSVELQKEAMNWWKENI